MKRTVKSFRIDPWNKLNLEVFCKANNLTATEVINDSLDSEYRPYSKWDMSEPYFEKVAKIIVNCEYLVKSKTVGGKVIPTLGT